MQIEHVRGDARKQAEKAAEFQRLLNIAKEDCDLSLLVGYLKKPEGKSLIRWGPFKGIPLLKTVLFEQGPLKGIQCLVGPDLSKAL